jgi:hypothetical protein
LEGTGGIIKLKDTAMKKMFLLIVLGSMICTAGFAQEEEEEEKKGGFKKENLFTGGSITLSFFSGTTVLGATPHFGYRIANWVDGGLVFNINYTGVRDYIEFDDKVKQTTYGGGLFTRLFPVHFLFAQAQLEHNFIKFKYLPAPNGSYLPSTENFNATSLLLGAGYTQGREPGSNTFFYVSLLFDVIKNENSPYVDVVFDPNTQRKSVRGIPIIRAGVNIGLFEGGRRRR